MVSVDMAEKQSKLSHSGRKGRAAPAVTAVRLLL